jgi:hypothetical protein
MQSMCPVLVLSGSLQLLQSWCLIKAMLGLRYGVFAQCLKGSSPPPPARRTRSCLVSLLTHFAATKMMPELHASCQHLPICRKSICFHSVSTVAF